MTREEAILLSAYTGFLLVPDFSEVHKFCEDTLGRPIWTHEFADQDTQKEIQEKLRPRIMELIQNISALRPVSREQVEKAWKGEWREEIVKRCDWKGHKREYYQPNSCSKCHKPDTGEGKSKFCPNCGAPMTDEAVQIVIERMEALHDKDV